MLNGADILCLSSIDWDFIWQGHQEIMSTLAAQGNRVLFIENTGVRAPTLKDLPRLRQRWRNWRDGTKGFRQVRENLVVYSPVILPFPYSRLARWVNRLVLLRALRRWMRAMGFGRPVVWSFLPTPLARDLIRALDPEMTVYYCIDDFATSSTQSKRIRGSERAFFREADLVFVTSEHLRQRAAQISTRVHLFPFGVNFERFSRVRQSPDGIPAELNGMSRPVVGYVGGIHQWVDQELLVRAAVRLPQATFVLVGPSQTDVSKLASCPNVRLLGKKAHGELPAYLKGFDVGVIPYRLSEYTANVYPTKLNEYLAMGLPVVATDLPEIRRFNAEHGAVVRVAKDAEAFVEGIRAVCGAAPLEERERRVAVARKNGWAERIAQMSALIEDVRASHRRIERWTWEQALRRLYRATRRRMLAIASAAALAYGAIFYTPVVWWAARPLKVTAVLHQADAIVVFAGGVGESGEAGQGYEERVAWAAELYRRGFARRLVFSSGYSYAFREPEVMKVLAMSLGVPSEAIMLEERATNTMENVRNARALLEQHGWRDILLVSSPYHMRRAVLTWRRLAPDIHVTAAPLQESLFYSREATAQAGRVHRQINPKQIKGILHEYVGLVYYWWRGWV